MSQSLEQIKIAKRYVTALFLSVDGEKETKSVVKDIADLGKMIDLSSDLQMFLKSPLVSIDQHKSGLEALAKKAKISKSVSNLLIILAENRRLPVLSAIISETEKHIAKESGTVPVSVATARKLTAADQKKIGDQIKKALGKDIIMQSYIDESLIGGLVIQIESTLIDGSLKTKLDKLERQLTQANAA